jgi:hypothetical protein
MKCHQQNPENKPLTSMKPETIFTLQKNTMELNIEENGPLIKESLHSKSNLVKGKLFLENGQ